MFNNIKYEELLNLVEKTSTYYLILCSSHPYHHSTDYIKIRNNRNQKEGKKKIPDFQKILQILSAHLPVSLNRGIVAGILDSRIAQQRKERDCGDGGMTL